MNLHEARALVTGGSSGIGRETARLLMQRGAKVAIAARGSDALASTARDIGAVTIPGDVGVEKDAVRMVATTIRELGGYNVLINNAGFGSFAPLVDLTVSDFEAMWSTNVLGAALVARESARHFISERRGTIVNVASTAGQRGFAAGSAYVATKFALRGMTECWRAELRQYGIRVMLISPSEVVTAFSDRAGTAQRVNESKLRPAEIAHAIVGMLEMDDRGFTTEATIWATNPKEQTS